MSTSGASLLKICFFNRSYWPDRAATGQLLTELAEDLVARHGCEVQVVCGFSLTQSGTDSGTWPIVRREERRGVTIVRAIGTRFRPRQFAGRAANYLTYFGSASLASLGIAKPDVVVTLTDPPIIGLTALATARRTGARFVFLSEDIFPEVATLLDEFHSDTVNRALDKVNRYLLRRADAIVAIGERMRERLVREKQASAERVRVIHNWADCEAIVPGSKQNPFACRHGLAHAFVVMHSGNVGFSQNLDTLIDAAERLRGYPDIVVAIVGDGARRESLRARVTASGLASVRFLDSQPKEALIDSFATADVFLVSLKAGIEGYIVPSKLYGILAAGRPYIAALDPSAEAALIAREHDCGILASPGDTDDLAAKILELYRDRDRAAQMGRNAREAALQFDRRRQVAAYYELFKGLTKAGGDSQF